MSLFPLASFSDRVAIIDGDNGNVTTYAQLLRELEQVLELKDFPKPLIFHFLQNRVDDVIAYVGAINAGFVVCLLDSNMPEKFKRQLVELYCPHYVFDASLQTQWKGFKRIKSIGTLSIFQQLDAKNSPSLNPKLQLLLATSGTTGNPKLIRLSKENLLSNAHSINKYLQITHSERAIASLPFHYSYGLSVLNTHLLAGASVVVTQSSVAQKPFWDIINSFQCTSLAGVPYTYKLMDRLGIDKLEIPSLHTLTQAGGKLESELVKKFHAYMRRRNGQFFVMYGQTEATARIAYLPPKYLPEKAAAIGVAIPNGKLQIFENDDEVTTPKKIGELVYQGPNVMLGYSNSPSDLSKGDELQGKLHTGDLGYFDEEGIFYVTGRLKRISKVYGLRINLDDLETSLANFGNIAVTTTDSEIFIFVENGSPEICEKCIQQTSELYQLHPSTFKCKSVSKIPRTSSGKIDYQQLS